MTDEDRFTSRRRRGLASSELPGARSPSERSPQERLKADTKHVGLSHLVLPESGYRQFTTKS